MALILCIETATSVCSVALVLDRQVISLRESTGEYTHAENLTVFMDEVLKEAERKPDDVHAVCVSKGPGSYTGLRIGVSAAKGFCYALDKPLLAVNTLFSMCREVHQPGALLCPMIDARRMEVYCAVYDQSGQEVKPTSAMIITENSFSDLLTAQKVCFFGDGAGKCKSLLSGHPNAVILDDVHPSAKNMAVISQEKYEKKEFEDTAYFEPFYLKEFIAGKKKA